MSFPKASCLLCLLGTSLLRGAYPDRPEAQAFVQTMVEHHRFEAAALMELLKEVQPQEGALQWVKPPASPVQKNWRVYRSRFIEPIRIKAGVAFWQQHRETLVRARQVYGVPEEIIVGILGVETIYGRNSGTFPVLDTLATLAFDYPEAPNRVGRMALFLHELEAYLLWCRETGQDPHRWKGSYAGAMGLPQFLPSSIRAWAVDFDGDGRVDLQGSPADAIGSVAHYLQAHGWEAGRPVDAPVTGGVRSQRAAFLRADGDPEPRVALGELMKGGLKLQAPRAQDPKAQVLIVDLPSPGRRTLYRVGYRNFYVITRYNRSFFYASAVSDLGRAVKARLDRPRRVMMRHRSGKP